MKVEKIFISLMPGDKASFVNIPKFKCMSIQEHVFAENDLTDGHASAF